MGCRSPTRRLPRRCSSPSTYFTPTAAFAIWTALSIFFTLWHCLADRIAVTSPRRRRTFHEDEELALFIFAISAFSMTVIKNIELGQVNLVLVLLIMFDTVTKAHYRGFLTGMAAGFKIVPAIFIVFMLVNRRWGDFGRALLGFLTTLAIGSFFGIGQVWQFLPASNSGIRRGSARPTACRMSLCMARSRVGSQTRYPGGPLGGAGCDCGRGGVGDCRPLVESQRRRVGAVVVGIIGLLVSPVSWSHHWVWFACLRARRNCAGHPCVPWQRPTRWHLPINRCRSDGVA